MKWKNKSILTNNKRFIDTISHITQKHKHTQ